MSQYTISQLSIYPVKSLGGIDLDQFELDLRGPKYDRHWMVVDDKGKFLTQRVLPKMCLIETRVSEGELTLSYEGEKPCLVGLDRYQTSEVQVWRDTVTSADCGDTAAHWLSKVLGKPCRLVSMPKNTQRLVDPDFASDSQTVGFADGFPLLLISQASLDHFNQRLKQAGFNHPIAMNRFRPNIVVSGNSQPHQEDQWREIKVNGITLSLVKLCSRCVMPSIDPTSSNKQSEIITELNAYRRQGRNINFGQNAIHDMSGFIKVGDVVEVIR